MIDRQDRFAFCFVSISPLRAAATDEAEIVSQLLFGEPIRVINLEANWVEINTVKDNYRGFVDPKQLLPLSELQFNEWNVEYTYLANLFTTVTTSFGSQIISRGSFIGKMKTFEIGDFNYVLNVTSNEPQNNPWDIANEYLNTPYLWGGKTTFGIDCSGLTQTVFRLMGIELPRDASQQENCGETISFYEKQPGDLAYFQNKKRKITHVGIIGPNSKIIHASGHVRIDLLKANGIWNESNSKCTHIFHSIKRVK